MLLRNDQPIDFSPPGKFAWIDLNTPPLQIVQEELLILLPPPFSN
jgi:hypothetical protein